MKRRLLLVSLLVALCAVLGGCKGDGSREFIPGKGWVPN